jgi:hypothetical protein
MAKSKAKRTGAKKQLELIEDDAILSECDEGEETDVEAETQTTQTRRRKRHKTSEEQQAGEPQQAEQAAEPQQANVEENPAAKLLHDENRKALTEEIARFGRSQSFGGDTSFIRTDSSHRAVWAYF